MTKLRTIKSYVLRKGRMSEAQERAFEMHWDNWGINFSPDLMIHSETIFNNQKPLIIEIGFGNGASLLEMANNYPDYNFIGIEVYETGVGRALNGIAELGLNNLKVIRHDAVEVFNCIPEKALHRVQIYFPDPWHKARHHKRRLIQKPFTDVIWTKLKHNGELHCATDWEHYAQWIKEILFTDNKWQNLGDETGYSPRPDFRPETKFERRGLSLGHGVWDLRYLKTEAL